MLGVDFLLIWSQLFGEKLKWQSMGMYDCSI